MEFIDGRPHYLSLGCGIQSTALFLMACHGEVEPGLNAAVFADTGWEREKTYEMFQFCQEMGEKHGIPVHHVQSGNIRTDSLDTDRNRFAALPFYINSAHLVTVEEQLGKLMKDVDEGLMLPEIADMMADQLKEYWSKDDTVMLQRQCTKDYKIAPIKKLIRRVEKASKKNPVYLWLGISMDEITRISPSDAKYQIKRFPLVEKRLTRNDCVKWLEKHDYPVPVKSSCVGCPFHSDDVWRELTPEEYADACDFDEGVRDRVLGNKKTNWKDNRAWLHRSRKPLRERPLKNEPSHEQEECTGHCFL